MVSLAILLIVVLLGSTFDCDSHMYSFLLLYSLTVLLLVVSLIVVLPGIPFNFPSLSFRVKRDCNTFV